MRRTAGTLTALSLALALAGCSQGGDDVKVDVDPSSEPPSPSASASPSETSEPPSSPATGDGSSAPEVVETVATGLVAPWGLAFLPDGDAVVTERDTAKVLQISGEAPYDVTELGTIGEAAPQGEGGLLGVAVSPKFDQDRTLFFYVSSADDNRVVTATLDKGGLSDTTPILTGIPLGSIHDGGRIEFGPDGFLYVSTGETGDPPLAQERDIVAGKILRITPKGKPAPGNPFGTAIWSLGSPQHPGPRVHRRRAAVGLGVRAEHLRRAQPDRCRRQLRLARGRGRGRHRRRLRRPPGGLGHRRRLPVGARVRRRRALHGRAARQPALEDPAGLRGRRGQPEAFFVGEYGRMRTVVVAPDGSLWLTTSNLDGRGSPADGDDRILRVQPPAWRAQRDTRAALVEEGRQARHETG